MTEITDAKTNTLKNEKMNSDFVRKSINKTEEFIYVSSFIWANGEIKQGVLMKLQYWLHAM